MDRPVLRGTPPRRPGARALRPVPFCLVPVPCLAVPHLVGADLGAAGGPGEGRSTGGAMTAITEMHGKLPPGTALEWTGLSYEERLSGGQAPALYALSLFVVFLCLAALYESWSVPISVLLVVPLGVIGAVFAAWITGLNSDIYLQVGLITTIGVSAKNAILIVEFAEERVQAGMNAFDAAMEAARLRLRPILMTSLAFVFAVLPLAVATEVGRAAGRKSTRLNSSH